MPDIVLVLYYPCNNPKITFKYENLVTIIILYLNKLNQRIYKWFSPLKPLAHI